MALDLEEQEQVEELKAWWKQDGGFVAARGRAIKDKHLIHCSCIRGPR